MTIKEMFDMLEKHNQLAELFQQPHLKPMRIYIAAYGYVSNYFKSFEQFRDYAVDEFIQPVAKSLINAEIRQHDTNSLIGLNENGEIIMMLSIYED